MSSQRSFQSLETRLLYTLEIQKDAVLCRAAVQSPATPRARARSILFRFVNVFPSYFHAQSAKPRQLLSLSLSRALSNPATCVSSRYDFETRCVSLDEGRFLKRSCLRSDGWKRDHSVNHVEFFPKDPLSAYIDSERVGKRLSAAAAPSRRLMVTRGLHTPHQLSATFGDSLARVLLETTQVFLSKKPRAHLARSRECASLDTQRNA